MVRIAFLLLASFALRLAAMDLYWHPVGGSDDANQAANWTTGSDGSGRSVATLGVTHRLRFDGTGPAADASCALTGNLSVGGIFSDTGNPYAGSLKDGGRTLTLANSFDMGSGTLDLTGILAFVQGNGGVQHDLRLPAGQKVHTLNISLASTDAASLLSQLTIKNTMNITGTGMLDWNGQRLVLEAANGIHAIAAGVSFSDIVNGSTTATVAITGYDTVITVPPVANHPNLLVDGYATVALTSNGAYAADAVALLEDGELILGANVGQLQIASTFTCIGGGRLDSTGNPLVLLDEGARFERQNAVGADDFYVYLDLALAEDSTSIVLANDGLTGELVIYGDLAGDGSRLSLTGSGATYISSTDSRFAGTLAMSGGNVDLSWDGFVSPGPVELEISGTGNTISGYGALGSLALQAGATGTLSPGEGADYGDLSLANADLASGAGASVAIDVRDVDLGIDDETYDTLSVDGTLAVDGSTTLVLDLTECRDAVRIEGLIRYGTLTGSVAAIQISLLNNGGNLTATLVDDAAHQEIDLVLTEPIVVNPPGTLTPPTIPLSSGRAVVYTAVCPGSAGNRDRMLAAIAAHPRNEVRAFAWDALVRRYVELPAQPSGGLQPWHGVFIASTVPLNLGFQTEVEAVPFAVGSLPVGWNLIGLPPLDDAGSTVIDIPFVDLESEYLDGTWQAPAANSDVIGTRAFAWTGSRYATSVSLHAWNGYWVYVQAPTSTASAGRFTVSAGIGMAQALATAPVGGEPSDPPPPPTSAQPVSEGGGCGNGSAFGLIVLVGALAFGLRRPRLG